MNQHGGGTRYAAKYGLRSFSEGPGWLLVFDQDPDLERPTPKEFEKMESAGEALPAPGPSDYPRFLGAEMTNWVPGDQLAADWFENPPKELWRKQIGEGWASFSVYGDYAFTMEQRGEKEVLVCYELRTGDAVWAHAEDVRFEKRRGTETWGRTKDRIFI